MTSPTTNGTHGPAAPSAESMFRSAVEKAGHQYYADGFRRAVLLMSTYFGELAPEEKNKLGKAFDLLEEEMHTLDKKAAG